MEGADAWAEFEDRGGGCEGKLFDESVNMETCSEVECVGAEFEEQCGVACLPADDLAVKVLDAADNWVDDCWVESGSWQVGECGDRLLELFPKGYGLYRCDGAEHHFVAWCHLADLPHLRCDDSGEDNEPSETWSIAGEDHGFIASETDRSNRIRAIVDV